MSIDESPKKAAIEPDDIGDRVLSEISAADFLRLLEQAATSEVQFDPQEAKVRDVLAGARTALRFPPGGLPEKKKVEREKWPPEQFPEKKKFELEKPPILEQFPEKKKVELEKQSIELPPDILDNIRTLGDRLTSIEEQLSRLQQ